MSVELIPCIEKDLLELKNLSVITFKETFAGQNQVENLADYLRQAFTLEKLATELHNPESFFYFLKQNRQTIGYLKLNVGQAQSEKLGADALEIERIYLKQSNQRMGLGGFLMKKSEEIAKQMKKKRVWLGVWEQNNSALAFYKKMGYQSWK